jgi:hypothetical protein
VLFSLHIDSKVMTNKSQDPLALSKRGYRSLSKASAPFSTISTFAWIDQANGVGMFQVTITGQSFAGSAWSYQWQLPENASSAGILIGEFSSPTMDSNITFELEVNGLDTNSNQNLAFQIKPVEGFDRRTVVIIPTHYEQTLEAEVANQFAPESNSHSMQKSVATRRQIPKGIQF